MAQWIKASDYGSEDWGFDSLWAHQLYSKELRRNETPEILGFFMSITHQSHFQPYLEEFFFPLIFSF
jgi:hypothetical protein